MVLDGLDVESEGWANDAGVLPVLILKTMVVFPELSRAYHEDAHLLLLALDLPDDAE